MGSLFQGLTTLTWKNFFPISNLNLPFNFYPLHPVLFLQWAAMTWQIAKYSLKSIRAALGLAYVASSLHGKRVVYSHPWNTTGNLCAVNSLASSVNAIRHLWHNTVLEDSHALAACWMAALLKAWAASRGAWGHPSNVFQLVHSKHHRDLFIDLVFSAELFPWVNEVFFYVCWKSWGAVSPTGVCKYVKRWRYKGASCLHIDLEFPSPAKESTLPFHEQS